MLMALVVIAGVMFLKQGAIFAAGEDIMAETAENLRIQDRDRPLLDRPEPAATETAVFALG